MRRPTLIFLNLTEDDLSCRRLHKNSKGYPILSEFSLPSHLKSELTIDVPKGSTFELIPGSNVCVRSLDEKYLFQSEEAVVIPLSLAMGTLWRAIPVHEGCPWRLYLTRVNETDRRLYVIPRRDLASFLSEMPDAMSLSSLCLPGTHDTMALYGWPISQCQELSTPLSVQLQSGIRVLDVRLAIVDSKLIAYHGIYPQRTPFQEILSIIHTFLTAPSTCRETLVMSIKQEDFTKFPYLTFSNLVREEIFNGPGGRDMWYLRNRIPNLGEVRGKVVMFSRFGGNGEGWEGGLEGLGIHPLVWPDSNKYGFSWQCKDTLVTTHDWYLLPSFLEIPEKFALASQILLPPPNNPPMPTLSIAFLSAANFPFALPGVIAKGFGWPKFGFGVEGVNGRFVHWLLNNLAGGSNSSDLQEKYEQRIRGWALLDFYGEPDSALTPLLVECNYRGRQKGEEGW